jgi:hypothetical protein
MPMTIASSPIGDLGRQAEWVSGRIEQHQMTLRFWLHLCSHGTKRERSALRPFEVLNVEVEMELLGGATMRPGRRNVVLHAQCGEEEVVDSNDDDVRRRVNDLPIE